MEEDIKILEETIDLVKRTGIDMTLVNKIENLLTRYKQQKAELDSVKEIYYTQKEMEDVMIRYRKLVESTIPKSKIKEKIKEIEEQENPATLGETYRTKEGIIIFKEDVLSVLQELLEEE